MAQVKRSIKKQMRRVTDKVGNKFPLTATLRNLERFHGKKAVLDAIKEYRKE